VRDIDDEVWKEVGQLQANIFRSNGDTWGVDGGTTRLHGC
jgi:hypothetical protein